MGVKDFWDWAWDMKAPIWRTFTALTAASASVVMAIALTIYACAYGWGWVAGAFWVAAPLWLLLTAFGREKKP